MRLCQYVTRAVLVALLIPVAFQGRAQSRTQVPAPAPTKHWVASWGTAQMIPEPPNTLAPEDWRDASLRQIVRVSLGGSRLRVKISNVFGTTPLAIEALSIAKSEGAGRPVIDARTARPLTFSGKTSVLIPAGSEYYSDPVDFEHSAGTDFAVSMHCLLYTSPSPRD